MKTIIKRIALSIAVLILWNITAQHVNHLFVPDPKTVFIDMIAMFQTGQLTKAIRYSFLRITVATLISGLIAFPIALLTLMVVLQLSLILFMENLALM